MLKMVVIKLEGIYTLSVVPLVIFYKSKNLIMIIFLGQDAGLLVYLQYKCHSSCFVDLIILLLLWMLWDNIIIVNH